ncbi:unnamed protein product [Sphagnum balticum]
MMGAARKLLEDWVVQGEEMAFRVATFCSMHSVPHCLVVNSDQTGMHVKPFSERTYEVKGAKQDAAFQREAMLECFKRKLLKDMEAPDHVSWDEDVVVGPDGDRDPADLALFGYVVVMWLSSEHYKLINLLVGLPFEEVMQGYMEIDPSLEEMELDDEVDLADWEANEFV